MKPKQFFLVLLGVFTATVLLAGGGYYLGMKQLSADSAVLSTGLASQVAADNQIENLSRVKTAVRPRDYADFAAPWMKPCLVIKNRPKYWLSSRVLLLR